MPIEDPRRATPHVSGAISAIREAQPAASFAQIENALALSGTPIFDARNGVTKQRINIPAGIEPFLALGGIRLARAPRRAQTTPTNA